MKPVRTDITNVTFTLPGGTEENGLPAYANLQSGDQPWLTSFWKLDGNDRYTLAKGGYIELTIVGITHPPVALRAVDPSDVSEPEQRSDTVD